MDNCTLPGKCNFHVFVSHSRSPWTTFYDYSKIVPFSKKGWIPTCKLENGTGNGWKFNLQNGRWKMEILWTTQLFFPCPCPFSPFKLHQWAAPLTADVWLFVGGFLATTFGPTNGCGGLKAMDELKPETAWQGCFHLRPAFFLYRKNKHSLSNKWFPLTFFDAPPPKKKKQLRLQHQAP